MSRYKEIDMKKVKTYTIKTRKSKVSLDGQAKPFRPDQSFETFYNNLPRYLAVEALDELVMKIAEAIESGKPVLLMMGAHPIKVGLNPVIIDLVRSGLIQGIALNGAGAIHDSELAYFGKTSEDVSASLGNGSFGMSRETAAILNGCAVKARERGLGFGEALGSRMEEDKPAYGDLSILREAYQCLVPVTVHVAVGTDIVHQHPDADGAAIGEASLKDFRIFTRLVSGIGDGGVLLHVGSAVILPEIFLKALTLARNINGRITHFTTANFDMLRHYRPSMNIVTRPVQGGGTGLTFTGHHEIMIPLLAAAVKSRIKRE